MTDLQPLFDYDTLQPDLREMVQEHTGEIRKLARRAAADIVEIGERLVSVKESLEHGGFIVWLKAEFGWDVRTAQRFMQVATAFKNDNLTHLNIAPSALYALASGSTPDFIRQEMVEMAQATGQPITHKAVKERLEAHQSEAPLPPEPEPEAPPAPPAPESITVPETTPPVQEPPAPPTPAYAGEMSPRKKSEPYTPLPIELEERERADGTKVLVPGLPTPPRKLEIKEKDWQKAADRFESAASGALTYLGKLAAYTPDELQQIMDSPAGRQVGTEMRVHQIRQRLQEVLDLLSEPEAQKTIDAAPLIEVLPPKKDAERVLEMN